MISDRALVWIDLEMTGLDINRHVILEIATIITDNDLNSIAIGPNLVIHHPDDILNQMNDWCKKQHGGTGLTQAVRASAVSVAQAEQETLTFLQTYCKKGTAILCGNSVYQDRAFMSVYMPQIIDFLNYRLIDVSSVKELVRRWYPKDQLKDFKKKDMHRALSDIEESIRELKYYRENFFKQ